MPSTHLSPFFSRLEWIGPYLQECCLHEPGMARQLASADTAPCRSTPVKRTFQPNNRRRARVHGFRLRMRTRAGRAIVSNRRSKGRRALTA